MVASFFTEGSDVYLNITSSDLKALATGFPAEVGAEEDYLDCSDDRIHFQHLL